MEIHQRLQGSKCTVPGKNLSDFAARICLKGVFLHIAVSPANEGEILAQVLPKQHAPSFSLECPAHKQSTEEKNYWPINWNK